MRIFSMFITGQYKPVFGETIFYLANSKKGQILSSTNQYLVRQFPKLRMFGKV